MQASTLLKVSVPKSSMQQLQLHTKIINFHVEYMTMDDYMEIANLEKANPLCGVTCHMGMDEDYNFFIGIFQGPMVSDKCLLCTMIHEIGHAQQQANATTLTQAHGSEFKKAATSIIRSVEKGQAGLPKPFCKVKLDKEFILSKNSRLSKH